MKVDMLLQEGKKYAHSDHVKLLLADLLGLNSLELLMHLDEEVTEEISEKWKLRLEGLKRNLPIQYIIGNVDFCGYNFDINENVLIPRFETEELVDETKKIIENYFPEAKTIIDLGCGSGVIGICLKKFFPNSEVTLLDISEKALKVAETNAKKLQADVKLIQGDMLEEHSNIYDVIISNPPYISEDEEIEDIVKQNEPNLALYGGKDGLDCYRKILKQVPSHTNNKYLLAFEIGYNQQEDIINLINTYLNDVEIKTKKDLSGRNRMIFVMHHLV